MLENAVILGLEGQDIVLQGKDAIRLAERDSPGVQDPLPACPDPRAGQAPIRKTDLDSDPRLGFERPKGPVEILFIGRYGGASGRQDRFITVSALDLLDEGQTGPPVRSRSGRQDFGEGEIRARLLGRVLPEMPRTSARNPRVAPTG